MYLKFGASEIKSFSAVQFNDKELALDFREKSERCQL